MALTTKQIRIRLILLTVLVLLIGIGFPGMVKLGLYSGGTIVSLPLCTGMALALLLSTKAPSRSFGKLAEAGLIFAVFLLIGAALLFSGEGFICLFIFGLVLFIPYLIGIAIGYSIQKYLWNLRVLLIGLGVVLLSATTGKPDYFPIHRTEDRIAIAAPAQQVWAALNQPVTFGASSNFWFRNGVSYPIAMELRTLADSTRILYCRYNNGTATGPVFDYASPSHFRFHFADSMKMMEEQNFLGQTQTMHLTHHLELIEGYFEVVPTGTASCELRAGSVYRHKFWPVGYYNFWFDQVFHRLHHHVLDRVRQQLVVNFH